MSAGGGGAGAPYHQLFYPPNTHIYEFLEDMIRPRAPMYSYINSLHLRGLPFLCFLVQTQITTSRRISNTSETTPSTPPTTPPIRVPGEERGKLEVAPVAIRIPSERSVYAVLTVTTGPNLLWCLCLVAQGYSQKLDKLGCPLCHKWTLPPPQHRTCHTEAHSSSLHTFQSLWSSYQTVLCHIFQCKFSSQWSQRICLVPGQSEPCLLLYHVL